MYGMVQLNGSAPKMAEDTHTGFTVIQQQDRIRLLFYGYFYEENVTKSKHPPQFFLVPPLIRTVPKFLLCPPPFHMSNFPQPPLARYEKIHLPPLKIMKVTNIHLVQILEGAIGRGMVMIILMKSSLAIFSHENNNINFSFIVSEFFSPLLLCNQNNLLPPLQACPKKLNPPPANALVLLYSFIATSPKVYNPQ